ncbi:GLABROUS1 enhancer-binding protein-like 3 isoform X1 [Arabidopsis lyrata subsp. lyrata]|uniref:GLABROUS1 enhancer-binding protein-like 3 isoform X1 n=1 Tax=Arabidopsis lyrata subsp. lyrata TaxID=81972 RepID=UPI000A29E57F|nr:GLABROUS1 enhancer-binding protein-like 3 isoform X1 [Arabidopsis lyrata subsp. lyrata]|eukprot:XP_020873198.1 GLABROUS1 enhancer-binding protein-like 3 isoform X1 [Arabidopsis lyrata subsp. lyrata]
MSKVDRLKNRRFRANQARATDGNIPYFTNTHDEQVFKLSKILWGTEKETNFAYEEDQIKEDVSCAVQEESLKIDDGEKDKCEEDGMDDLRLLQEALVLAASFQSLGNNQRKSLLQNLRNVGATQRKELKDDWKALLAEEMQLDIKKQSFYAKLVNAGFSA